MHPRKLQFIELFEATGWKQAEAARKLDMTRGGLNGIITGNTIPSAATLQLLVLKIKAELPHLMPEVSDGRDELRETSEVNWRERAERAEAELRRLREDLKSLGTNSAEADAVADQYGRAVAAKYQKGAKPNSKTSKPRAASAPQARPSKPAPNPDNPCNPHRSV